MAYIGRSGVSLLPRERVVARLMANHIRDDTYYEGYLYVTSQRLVHIPWSAARARDPLTPGHGSVSGQVRGSLPESRSPA